MVSDCVLEFRHLLTWNLVVHESLFIGTEIAWHHGNVVDGRGRLELVSLGLFSEMVRSKLVVLSMAEGCTALFACNSRWSLAVGDECFAVAEIWRQVKVCRRVTISLLLLAFYHILSLSSTSYVSRAMIWRACSHLSVILNFAASFGLRSDSVRVHTLIGIVIVVALSALPLTLVSIIV